MTKQKKKESKIMSNKKEQETLPPIIAMDVVILETLKVKTIKLLAVIDSVAAEYCLDVAQSVESLNKVIDKVEERIRRNNSIFYEEKERE